MTDHRKPKYDYETSSEDEDGTSVAVTHGSRDRKRTSGKNTRSKGRNKNLSLSGSESRSRSAQKKEKKKGKTRMTAPKKEPQIDADSLNEEEGEEEGVDVETMEPDVGDDIQIIEESTAQPGTSQNRPHFTMKSMEEVRNIMEEAARTVDDLEVRESCPALKGNVRQSAGQGRPVETGDYYLKQIRKATEQLITAAQELKVIKEDFGISKIPAKRSANRKAEELRAMEELRNAPLKDLPRHILEAVDSMDVVVDKSKNLHGKHQGMLKKAAAWSKAAVTQMVQRYESPEEGVYQDIEMERLRERIAVQEKEILELHGIKAQCEQKMRELQERMEQIERTEDRRQERELRKAEGAKKRRFESSPEASASEMEMAQAQTPTRWEEEERMETEHSEKEREEAERNRLRLLKEIKEQGMPPVVRPSLKGVARIIEPAVPASSETAEPEMMETAKESTKDTRREDGLARMLVECVNEKVDKMGEQLLAKLVDMFPQLTIKGKEENKSSVPTPSPNKVPDTDGQVGKSKGKKGKGKGKGGEKAAGGNTSVPTAAKPASQLRAKPQVLGGNKEPRPTSAAPATKPQERRQVPGKEGAVPGTSATSEWTEVVKRKPKTAGKGTKAGPTQGPANGPKGGAGKKGSGVGSSSSSPSSSSSSPPKQEKKKRRKVPRTSAVTLTCPPETYAECMSVVRQKIALAELGIEKAPHVRRTATGALSLELSGQNNAAQADRLATRMAQVLSDREGVRVGRPMLTADLRLWGFEESVTAEEIKGVLATKGNTSPDNIRVGPIRKGTNGLCSVLASCPLTAANTITRETRVTLGWCSTRVEMLDKRPLQCYKCLEHGHTRATCKSNADRTGACYRCGETGHAAGGCTAPVKCIVCAEKGKPSGHRVGGPSCTGCKRGKGGRGKGQKAGEKPAEVAQPQKNPQQKTRRGPTVTNAIEVTGYQVTCSGRIIAGVPTGAGVEPPKEQRKKKERKINPPASSGQDAGKMDVEESQSVNEEHMGVPPTERREEGTPMQVDREEPSSMTEVGRGGLEESGNEQR